jgi:hypothetical protein
MVDLDHPAETWGLAVSGSLAALAFTALPVVALVRLVPSLKEAAVGAALVYRLLDTTDTSDAAAFAVLAGMAATLVFNAFRVVATRALGVEVVGGGADALATAGAGAEVAAVLRLAGLLAVLFASPVGYAVGGAAGAWLNSREGGEDGGDDEERTVEPADGFESS